MVLSPPRLIELSHFDPKNRFAAWVFHSPCCTAIFRPSKTAASDDLPAISAREIELLWTLHGGMFRLVAQDMRQKV